VAICPDKGHNKTEINKTEIKFYSNSIKYNNPINNITSQSSFRYPDHLLVDLYIVPIDKIMNICKFSDVHFWLANQANCKILP
jgi:hypothetical protein